MKREMKMVKKLIAIAVVALMATSVHAGIEVYGEEGAGKLKTEGTEPAFWPFEYKALDLCAIPVIMEIGYYVELKECGDQEFKLKQVDCGDIGKGAGDWPCYLDCQDLTIRSNFQVKLGLRLEKDANGIIKEWSAAITGDVSVIDPGETTIEVCIKAWQAQLWKAAGAAGSVEQVGQLVITVKPNV